MQKNFNSYLPFAFSSYFLLVLEHKFWRGERLRNPQGALQAVILAVSTYHHYLCSRQFLIRTSSKTQRAKSLGGNSFCGLTISGSNTVPAYTMRMLMLSQGGQVDTADTAIVLSKRRILHQSQLLKVQKQSNSVHTDTWRGIGRPHTEETAGHLGVNTTLGRTQTKANISISRRPLWIEFMLLPVRI